MIIHKQQFSKEKKKAKILYKRPLASSFLNLTGLNKSDSIQSKVVEETKNKNKKSVKRCSFDTLDLILCKLELSKKQKMQLHILKTITLIITLVILVI